MSQKNVEVVRAYNGPYEGENLVPRVKEGIGRVGPDPQPDAVLAVWAEDPAFRHLHPDIEWDVSAVGAVGSVPHGARELALWWAEWVEVWESYVYRMLEYRDLGDWVLTPTAFERRRRGGIAVEARVCQMWQVRDGKIAVLRAFLTEQEALEAVGLRE
jgi:ketosteroid isomerase-like protein